MNGADALGSGSWPARHHLGGLVLAGARALGQRPFVTFLDDASGERTELGWASMENWSAKVANLLVEELGLAPGEVLSCDLGTHWTCLALMLGAWRAGVVVSLPGAAAAPAAWAVLEGAPRPSGPHVVVGRGIGGRLLGPAGDGIAFAEVLASDDAFADHDGAAEDPALLATAVGGPLRHSHADLLAAGRAAASLAGLRGGERFLSAVPADVPSGVAAAAVLPLALRGGVVLVTGASTERLVAIAGAERCRALLVPGGRPPPRAAVPVVVLEPALAL